MASCIALYDRAETGEGQFIDISVQEAVAMTGMDAMPAFDLQGRNLPRSGWRGVSGLSHVCPAKDGWIKFIPLYVRVGPGWKGLLDWMDTKGMAGDLRDPRWEDEAERKAHLEALEERAFAFLSTMTRKEAVPQAQQRGYMCMPVQNAADLFEDEQLLARRFFTGVPLPGLARPVQYPGPPVRMQRTPWRASRRPPLPGEDNAAVYLGELGLSRRELQALAAAGVV
jgi:crotonobetainyl-CoA:carnitine CoA-transferase CaiB-like acyl-CoA transferase